MNIFSEIQFYVSEEKRNRLEVLKRLKVIDEKKLFATLGYPSLYEYCVKELKYSEGAACRRIKSVRIMREVPEVEQKLKAGQVNETQLSQVQGFLRTQRYSKEEKLLLLEKIEGKSTRETEKLLAGLAPEEKKPEKVRPINANEVEIRFTANEALQKKIERLREVLGFQLEDQSYATLIDKLADIALKKVDRNRQAPPAVTGSFSDTRYTPEKTKVRVTHRNDAQCAFVTEGGKRCTSRFALQFDHIIPYAHGGPSTEENLQLLCPAHNQLKAMEQGLIRRAPA